MGWQPARPPGLSPPVAHPFIYEINTWAWLESISAEEDKPIDLGSVPQRHWDEIAGLGFDAVWLMGVWRRSPAGIGDRTGKSSPAVRFPGRSSRLACRGRRRVAVLRQGLCGR